MKLQKYIIGGVIAFSLLFSSCNDWLEVEPENTRTTDYFYKTPSEMQQALMGIYNGLLPISNSSLFMSEVRSDNVWTGDLTDKQKDYMDISTINPYLANIATLNSAWKDLFAIVSRSNEFLAKIENLSFDYTDKIDVKSAFKGEARFLRALAYFELVRYFGRVPMPLAPQTIQEAMSTKQSETKDIYEQAIIPDLKYAIEFMGEKATDYKGAEVASGRATKIAAQALLGRVYLTMAGFPLYDEEKKEKAKEQFEKVLEYADKTGKYWAKNADEWKKIWISDNDNKYHIFEIQYIAAKGYGNPMVFQSVPNVPSEYIGIAMSGNSITCSTDLNTILKSEKDANNNYLDVRCLATIDTTKYVNDDNPNSITKYGGDDFFIKLFEHKMKRKALGYEDIDAQIVDRTYFPLNYPLIRLEDVMLMYAEIVGPTTKGIEMVDKIRVRAGLSKLGDADKSPERFQECVELERRKELAFEGIRWHDLVRHNNYSQVIRDKFMSYAVDKNGNIVRPATAALINRVVPGTHLYPIPNPQMKVKEGLYEQNEAYK